MVKAGLALVFYHNVVTLLSCYRTYNEHQTAVHYAAKNDAVDSLRMLRKLDCNVEVKDSKQRTPVHVAAELDRSETALFLVDEGTACLTLYFL